VALADAQARERRVVAAVIQQLRDVELRAADVADQQLGRTQLVTLASEQLAGQVVHEGEQVPYASLCATTLREVGMPCEPDDTLAGPGWLERLRRWLLG
jgi:hypothetical protein